VSEEATQLPVVGHLVNYKPIFNKMKNRVQISRLMGFIQKWFGFSGWKELSTSKRIGVQILYRILFLVGMAACLIIYTMIFGDDPPLAPLCGIMLIWFLMFQFFINLIFVNSS
tara:strand:+ start:520 stop:858 length:339 start_codon:yes stop_codon:yes gene_type:complete